MSISELTKQQKKHARQIIETGLQRELRKGISQIKQILETWDENAPQHTDVYHAIYKNLTSFDKHIARRYDEIKGSTYIFVMAGQLADNIITLEDLSVFDDDLKNKIIGLSRFGEDG